MKKRVVLGVIALSMHLNAWAANDLIQAFRDGVSSDPTYQQAIAQRLSTREGVPISLAGLLPFISASLIQPSATRTLTSGAVQGNTLYTQNGYNVALNLSQTVFDFGKFAGLSSASALAKGADATLSAATQDLMLRVATAYFTILKDQDNLVYIKSTRAAYYKQLDQVTQQYRVGLKTVTEVYTAKASYETSIANYIAAEATLATDKENLRAMTGVMYPSLLRLSDSFPLVTPEPADIDAWVTTAGQQNWLIKAAQFSAKSSRDIIKQQFAGHLPTMNLQGSYVDNYYRSSGDPFLFSRGSSQTHTSSASINFNIPLVAGGLVVAQTAQAKYNYEVALQQLEFQLRSTLTLTRQSYLNVVAGISKIAADKLSIKSNISSLRGMEAGYRVGTEILVNVLNQQQNVVQAQQQYASDRYAYVINLLTLKQAAGTLSEQDLFAVNMWLSEHTGIYGENTGDISDVNYENETVLKTNMNDVHSKAKNAAIKKLKTAAIKVKKIK
ncbi:MAG: TolC family outer membrane protein [Gammaproteobacteria bacterium]